MFRACWTNSPNRPGIAAAFRKPGTDALTFTSHLARLRVNQRAGTSFWNYATSSKGDFNFGPLLPISNADSK